MKSGFLCAAAFFAATSSAASADYLPLEIGNKWVLQTSAGAPEIRSIEVLRSRTVNGAAWFLVAGYAPSDRWLRTAPDGSIYALDEKTGAEELLARPVAGAARYSTALGGCQQTAQPAAATSRYRGPNYDLDGALAVQYAPESCRDIGITQEVYAPGLGLVSRAITTIRGEIVFHLVYARVGRAAVLGKSKEIVLVDDFQYGSHGWLPGFADYSLRNGDLRMLAELRPLPDELGAGRSAYYIQSMNRSDDLFMFLKRHVGSEDGLQPNQAYRVSFEIRFASNAPTGCFGVGGSPGDSVYLKAGAAADEPLALLDTAGDVRLSIDKGQQAAGGKDAGLVGTIANGAPCQGSVFPYLRVRKEYAHDGPARTDGRGAIWLLVGTDSGFEGLTGLYVESIVVRIDAAVQTAGRQSIGRRRR